MAFILKNENKRVFSYSQAVDFSKVIIKLLKMAVVLYYVSLYSEQILVK